MATIGELVVKISGDNTDLNQALNESSKNSDKFASNMASAFASVGIAAGVLALAVKGIEFNKAAEQAKVAFTVMTGSAQKATETLKKLKDFADKTPLEFKDLRSATQTLMQFGIGADEAVELIKDLGDVSSGNADKLQSLALAFGQMSATGRLMGQDLNQMINAGFNPLQQIAKDMAKEFGGLAKDYMPQLKASMEAGAISVEMVRDAFTSATSEGGIFYQSLEKQSETLTGVTSTLNDAFESFLGKMTDAATGPLKAAATLLTQMLNTMSELPGPVLNAAGAFVAIGSALVAATGAARVLGITLSTSMGPIGLIIAGVTAGIVLLSSAIMGAVQEQENLNKAMDKTSKMSNQERIDILEKEKIKIGEQITQIRQLQLAEVRQFGERSGQVKKFQSEIDSLMKRQGELSVIQQDANAKIKESAKKEAEANKVIVASVVETKDAKKEAADAAKKAADEELDRQEVLRQSIEDQNKAKENQVKEDSKNLEERKNNQKEYTDFIESESEKEAQAIKDNQKSTVDFIANQFGRLSPELGKAAEDIGSIFKKIIDGTKISLTDTVTAIQSTLTAVFSIIQQASDSYYQQQLESLDVQTQAELEAAGVAEETAVQKAQKELDAAKVGGDAELILEKENALKKEKILADADRERSKIEYESKKTSHDLMILQTISAGALAIVQGFAQLGPVGGAIAAVATAVVTGAQLGILAANAPKPPKYAKGTSFHPGGAALVGEFGAELIQLPRGSAVATAQETRNIMNNTTSNAPVFNFYSPEALDPSEMEKRFILSQREAAYMGVFA